MSRRILIVEDNPDASDVLSEALRYAGYEVMQATDGQAGIDLALSESPDLIMLDMSLPIKSGWDVAAELRENSRTADVPILAITAHALDSDRQHALDVGCNDYLIKPIKPRDILKKIKSVLDA